MPKVWDVVNVDGDLVSLRARLNDLDKDSWTVFSIFPRSRTEEDRGYKYRVEYWTVIIHKPLAD